MCRQVTETQISVDYNGQTSAKIQAKWLHGHPKFSWSDLMAAQALTVNCQLTV